MSKEDAPTPTSTLELDAADHAAERDLWDILIAETRHLGSHAAGPRRRSASGRVETKIQLLRDQLPCS